jgi:hypothetical protein
VLGKFRTWSENLSAKGIVRGGQALGREGCVISGKVRRSINDGPFAEAKEVIGGYLLLNADSLKEATAIAKGMPGLDVARRNSSTIQGRAWSGRAPFRREAGSVTYRLIARFRQRPQTSPCSWPKQAGPVRSACSIHGSKP